MSDLIFMNRFDVNTEEYQKGLQMLEKVGVKVSVQTLPDATPYLQIVIDEVQYKSRAMRNAGRGEVYLKDENGQYATYPVEEVRSMMHACGGETTAKRLGVSRRTLYRKLKRAKEEGSDTLY